MAVSAVWRLVSPLTAYPSETRSRPQHTGETGCAPLLKSKCKRLLVLDHFGASITFKNVSYHYPETIVIDQTQSPMSYKSLAANVLNFSPKTLLDR